MVKPTGGPERAALRAQGQLGRVQETSVRSSRGGGGGRAALWSWDLPGQGDGRVVFAALQTVCRCLAGGWEEGVSVPVSVPSVSGAGAVTCSDLG